MPKEKETRIKRLFANISLVVLLNLLVKPVWVLMEMELQDQLGHEAWGLYAALLSLGYLMLTFADLGINQYATKTLSSEPQRLTEMFPVLFSAKIALTFFYPILMMGVGWALGYREEALYLLFLLCLVQGGNQLAQFFRANFQALQRFNTDAWLSVAERLVLIALTLGLFWLGLSLEGFVWARLLAVTLTIVLFYVLLSRSHGFLRPRWKLPMIREVVGLSLSFALMTILYSVHDKIDQVMIERLAGSEESGLYAGAYRWLEAFSMYLWLVLPIFFARFAFYDKNILEQQRLLVFGQKITALPLIFVSLFVLFFGEKLLFLFNESSPEQLATMLACLQVLFLTVLINSIFAIFSTLLTSTGHVKPVNYLIVGAIVMNIVLNFIFIPPYGAVASAWTTLASYALVNVAYTIYIQLRLDIQLPYLQMVKLLLLAGLTAGLFQLLVQTALPWWISTAICGGSYVAMAFLLQILKMSELKALRK